MSLDIPLRNDMEWHIRIVGGKRFQTHLPFGVAPAVVDICSRNYLKRAMWLRLRAGGSWLEMLSGWT